MIKRALLLLLGMSMHDAFIAHSRSFRMSLSEDVCCDIERTTRQLCLHKAATRGVVMRKRQLLDGASNVSTKEHRWLNEMFGKLNAKESEIHSELQELIVTALMQQVNASK
jgi:hypothetical protein